MVERGSSHRPGKVLLLLVFATMLFSFAGCGRGDGSSSRGTYPDQEASGEGPVQTELVPCPLNGEKVPLSSLGLRPLAVVVDNSASGRPQSGLGEACVVYETLAEGGITRLLAIFLHPSSTPVGPVRSGRDYFLDIAVEYDAVLAHVGGSPQFYREIERSPVKDLDDLRGEGGFRRIKERPSPYNLYTDIDSLRKAAARNRIPTVQTRGDSDISWRFVAVGEALPGSPTASSIDIGYGGFSRYRASYHYDSSTGKYLRSVNGEPHLAPDRLEAGSVVVQFVRVQAVKDDPEGRLRIDATGNGKGLVFSGGRVSEVQWSKPSRWSPTRFRTKDGQKPAVAPGAVWFHLVPTGSEVKWS